MSEKRFTLEDLNRRGALRFALATGLLCGALLVYIPAFWGQGWLGLVLVVLLVVLGGWFQIREIDQTYFGEPAP